MAQLQQQFNKVNVAKLCCIHERCTIEIYMSASILSHLYSI